MNAPFRIRSASIFAIAGLLSGAAALLQACNNDGGVSAESEVTVVVLVVDSLMPEEIDSMPTLAGLRDEGTSYPESRAVFSAETIPNHVAMMTGVYPARNGIPANNFWDKDESPDEPTDEDLEKPKELVATTLFTRIHSECRRKGTNTSFRHAATLSKKYLFEIFKGDLAAGTPNDRGLVNVSPDTHWDPRDDPAYLPAPDEHTPDAPTMTQALTQLGDADFHFINLGDIDRGAHGGGEGLRAGALADADTAIGRLVTALEDDGRWEQTVLIVTSDHGMDFSAPGTATQISVQDTLDALADCFEPMFAVDNGATHSIYVSNLEASRGEKNTSILAARNCLMDVEDCDTICAGATRPANADGIEFAWYVASNDQDPDNDLPVEFDSSHPNLGDLVLSAAPGFKFGEGSTGNPLPGNHGHLVTMHNTMIVSGGSPWVRRGVVVEPSMPADEITNFDRLPEQSENVDVAPTVAWLLGLPQKGFEGRILREAFVQFDEGGDGRVPTRCGIVLPEGTDFLPEP